MEPERLKQFKHLDTIGSLFVAVLIISNVASVKIVDLNFLIFDGGTLLFPLSYIFNDILTEVYGYKISRKVIWLGFISVFIMALTFTIVGSLPAASDWDLQEAYNSILGQTPRIVIASLIAYLVGEFTNSFILAKLKIFTKGKMLWSRTIGSTVIGQLVDSVFFVLIAFYGLYPDSVLLSIVISNYIFKTLIEIIFTPLTYKTVSLLKRVENVDHYDYKTNFNPFSFK